MSTYIFSTFWPLIKALQILGLFPIKKSSENLCGFEALPTGKYLVLTVTVLSLGFAFYYIPFFLVMSKHNLGLLELLHAMIALNGSSLDDITYFGVIILMCIFEIGVVIGMFSLKSQLIKLLELFQGITKRHAKLEGSWKSKSMLLCLVICWLLFTILDTVGFLTRLIDQINVDISTAVMFGVLHFVSMIILNAGPGCSFLMLFSEPCHHLNAWMKSLSIQIVESKEQLDKKIICECKQFFYKGKGIKHITLSHLTFKSLYIKV